MQKIFFPYCGETMGGSHFSSLLLIKKLKKDFKIIIGIHKSGIFYNYCKNKKINFKFLNIDFFSNSRSTILNVFFFSINLYFYINFLKKKKIDIIHINEYRMLNTWALPAYLAGIKKIILHQRNPLPISRVVTINLSFITHIVSISKFVQFSLSKRDQKKSKIIINPIEKIKNFKVKSTNAIGFVANDSKRKRSDIFFSFAERLVKNKKDFNFIVIGNFTEKKIKFIYKKYPILKNKLKFTGFLENPYKIMKTLKFIICPSENEGFGRVHLEAAYLNVPCILNYSGAYKEFKRFNLSLFVKKNNVSNYLNIYKKILNLKLKKKLIKNGIEYNKDNTLPHIHAKKIFDIYKE
jgi:L-malate glycosyltransferase